MSSNAQAAVARLPSSAFDRHQAPAAKSRGEIGVRNAAETMFMIARTMFINLKFLANCQQWINFSATRPKVAILALCLVLQS